MRDEKESSVAYIFVPDFLIFLKDFSIYATETPKYNVNTQINNSKYPRGY